MAWESRKRGGLYYTQSYREGGRVRRRYFGAGHLAEIIAESHRLSRDLDEAERQRKRSERAEEAETDREFRDYFDSVEEALEATLIQAGYHKHKGQWRKRRGQRNPEEHIGEAQE